MLWYERGSFFGRGIYFISHLGKEFFWLFAVGTIATHNPVHATREWARVKNERPGHHPDTHSYGFCKIFSTLHVCRHTREQIPNPRTHLHAMSFPNPCPLFPYLPPGVVAKVAVATPQTEGVTHGAFPSGSTRRGDQSSSRLEAHPLPFSTRPLHPFSFGWGGGRLAARFVCQTSRFFLPP